MESLIQEELEASKDIPKNVKFHQAYELARVTAEEVSGCNTDAFLELMEALKNIFNFVKEGTFPRDLFPYLNNPSGFKIDPIGAQ